MAYLLDTSILIDVRDGRGDIRGRVQALDTRPSLSAVSKVELEGGVVVDRARMAARRIALDALLRRFPVIDFSSQMASIYGEIVDRVGFDRRKSLDRMIAATAIAFDLALVTANGRDFTDIPKLKLEVWN